MNQWIMYIPLTNYATIHLPKLQRMHMSLLWLFKYLLDELENSEKNPGHTCYEEIYDNDLYLSMKAFWDLFTGEITHEYSVKILFQNRNRSTIYF